MLCALVLTAFASPVRAGGFALHEMGSKAILFGGAFSAQASDLSAMFYNPAGLAQNTGFSTMAGLTLIPYFSELEGASPFPGAGYHNDMQTQVFYPPHVYAGLEIKKGLTVAFGVWSPYGLSTNWEDPDQFRGRFLSQRVDLRHFAIGVQAAYQVTDWLSIGAGPELRLSDVKLQRNIGQNNPFTNRFVDIGHLDVVSDGFDSGWSFGAGIQLKPMPNLRLGVSYHHSVDIDYTGSARLYQIPSGSAQFDAVLAARLPFGTPIGVETTVQYPSITMIGASYDITPRLTVEADAYYTTWDVFTDTTLKFDNAVLGTSVLPHDWENAWRFSGGLNFQATPSFNLGLGAVYDQTPQPDEDVSPLLPDSNRTGFTIGLGYKLGKTTVEVSNMFLFFHERTTTTNHDNFNATYKTFADLFVFSLRHSF